MLATLGMVICSLIFAHLCAKFQVAQLSFSGTGMQLNDIQKCIKVLNGEARIRVVDLAPSHN